MTVKEQIRALGGPTKVAQILEVGGKRPSVAAVIMWGCRNWIPYRWKAPIEALLASHQSEVA